MKRWILVWATVLFAVGCGGATSSVTVPDVVGDSLDSATDLLEALDLDYETEDAVADRGVWDQSNWVVVGQVPAAGETAERESAVALSVEKYSDSEADPVTPTPTTDEERIADAVSSTVGDRGTAEWNADTGTVTVRWEIDSNVTQGLTRAGARLDGTALLEALRDAGVPWSGLVLRGSHPLVDQLGNTSNVEVVNAVYQRPTVDAINFAGFNNDNVWMIAEDGGAIHPEFRD